MQTRAELFDRIRPEVVDAHLRLLSHPLLEGRAPGTRGGDLAVEYVRAQFRRIGLEPVGDSYLQSVPLIGMTPDPSLTLLLPDGSESRPGYRDDYVLEAGVPEPELEADAEMVYVGYGISAPEYDWDDYADADVTGKIVLVRVNDPGTAATPDFFGGRALTYYGRWTYKFEEAARRGAAGALLIHTDESAGYGWNVVRTSNTGEQFDLAGATGPALRLRGWVRYPWIADVLGRAGYALSELGASSGQRGFRPIATGIRVRAKVRSTIREVRTANCVGRLAGGSNREEAVLLTSHYDHLGTGTDEQGRATVYHGAYDNASGVALLLAVAEAAATLREPPARSLVFLCTTAEESGLLGAEWYATHPLIPLEHTAAVLNLDGANLQGRTRDLAPLGTDRSSVGDVVRSAAANEGMIVSPEAHPEQGMFFRQDHFPFAKAGVPALALDHGLNFIDRPAGWGEAWYETFNREHYHQPSDAYREDFDYRGAVQQGRVLLRTALAIADATERPTWHPGAGFARRP